VEEREGNEVVTTATEQLANLLEKPALLVCGLVTPHIKEATKGQLKKHIVNYYSTNALDGILFKGSEFPPLTLVTSVTLAVMGSWGSVHVQSLILVCNFV